MLDTKKPVGLATGERNDKNYSYYITDIMKFVDTPTKKYELARSFFILNEDDLTESDREEIAEMMGLIKIQMEQHEGDC